MTNVTFVGECCILGVNVTFWVNVAFWSECCILE